MSVAWYGMELIYHPRMGTTEVLLNQRIHIPHRYPKIADVDNCRKDCQVIVWGGYTEFSRCSFGGRNHSIGGIHSISRLFGCKAIVSAYTLPNHLVGFKI
jgi:hypothetical protein